MSMELSDKLNEYIDLLGCSAKEIAEVSDLSQSVVSRYRTGERVPTVDGDQIKKLAHGIYMIGSADKFQDAEWKANGWSEEQILDSLVATLTVEEQDYKGIIQRLNTILSLLKVNLSELAHSLNYDASYISRIRSGQRKPANIHEFLESIAQYLARKYNKDIELQTVAQLIGVQVEQITSEDEYSAVIYSWLLAEDAVQDDFIGKFLKQVDEFNLDDYIKAIHFDELKVPNVPFQITRGSKRYYGLEEIKQGNLDFLKTTVLSKSMEPVYMYDDTPMADLARDSEFPKQWMFGLAMMLKKGLHLNIIHNLNRPFEEMMLGLEAWIPMYMTGQVSPYYFKGVQNQVFNYFLNTSGAAALEGECISGFHENVRYYLTKNKDELEYYRTRSKNMIERANPLMDIYRHENKKEYDAFITNVSNQVGNRQERLAAPPIYTMPEDLLLRIIERCELSNEDSNKLLAYHKESVESVERILSHSIIRAEIPDVSREEFEKYPLHVAVAGAFLNMNIDYTYEEYLEHMEITKEFASKQENYQLICEPDQEFRNIQIVIQEGEWAMVSKNLYPTIHFVIRHPKLLYAMENMITPVSDKK